MQFRTFTGNPVTSRAHCVVVGVYDKNNLSPSAERLDKTSRGTIKKVLARGDISGAVGQTLLLQDLRGIQAPRVLLVGLGKPRDLDTPRFLSVLNSASQALAKTQTKQALVCLLEAEVTDRSLAWTSQRLVEQFLESAYRFTEMKGKPPVSKNSLTRIDLLVDRDDTEDVKEAIRLGKAVATGVTAHKNISNLPGNVCTPTFMADAAKALAKSYKSVTTKVLSEADMTKLGMGAFMAVSQGSEQPGKMIIMKHQGSSKADRPFVIVGKGITFDTGGISLKSNAGMADMIFDMCGAASVLGTMTTIAELKLPINVVGVIAAAENMPSGRATRPGDIVTSMSGQTVEIMNTDAEGRLVLCDALTYIEKYNPVTVIDVATLTGAAIVALGSHASALFSNDDALAQDILDAGTATHDRAWRLPIWEDYQTALNSALADMQNVGGREASSIVAACFLARFTRKYRWAHLDIAATSFKSGAAKGATSRPVGMLTQYLIDRSREYGA
ncbi:MAG: leucyl aminopeptidase [Pseudomonadales bacterium]|nr:leucyl aminopeptidase [Pseudomonadales bacterium]